MFLECEHNLKVKVIIGLISWFLVVARDHSKWMFVHLFNWQKAQKQLMRKKQITIVKFIIMGPATALQLAEFGNLEPPVLRKWLDL